MTKYTPPIARGGRGREGRGREGRGREGRGEIEERKGTGERREKRVRGERREREEGWRENGIRERETGGCEVARKGEG
jgi:hypothetical protein